MWKESFLALSLKKIKPQNGPGNTDLNLKHQIITLLDKKIRKCLPNFDPHGEF